jgi:multidrug resistance protein, MATE family
VHYCSAKTYFCGRVRILKTNKKAFRKIIRLGFPAITGQLGLVLMGVFDNAMIGQVGHVPLAAASVANNVFFIPAVFGIGLLMVIPALISIIDGQKEKHDLSKFVKDGFWVSVLVSIITFIALLASIKFFGVFKQQTDVAELAKPYLNIISYSVLPMFLFMLFKGISDGHSDTRPSMIITLVALVLNVFLNWLFIYGHWGFEALGLNGAGWATLWSRIFMALMMFIWVLAHKKIKIDLHTLIRKSATGASYIKLILKKGIPSGFQFFFEVTAFAIAGILAGQIGSREQASHQIAMNLATVTYMFMGGLSTAGMIVTGEFHSSRNVRKIREYAKHILILGFGFTVIFSIIFIAFRTPLSAIFNENPDVIDIAAKLLLFAAAFQMFDGIQVIHQGILRGMEDTYIPSLITMLAYWFVTIPLCYIFGIVFKWSVYGIWLGLTVGLIISATLLSFRIKKLLKLPPTVPT